MLNSSHFPQFLIQLSEDKQGNEFIKDFVRKRLEPEIYDVAPKAASYLRLFLVYEGNCSFCYSSDA